MSEELEKKGTTPETETELEDTAEAAVEEEPQAGAEPELEPEPEPEPEPEEKIYVRPVRQWITLHSGSLDQRVGWGIIEKIGKDAKGLAGLPHVAVLARTSAAREDLVEEVRRYLVEAGFRVEFAQIQGGADACTIEEALSFQRQLGAIGATGDDIVIAVGDAYALSVAAYVSASWFGGVPFIQVPCDLEGSIMAGTTPYGLSVPGSPQTVCLDSHCRMSVTDLSYLELSGTSEPVLMARALMIASSILESEHTFAHLFDRADKLAEGIREDVCQQLAETVRSRGRTIANASIAIRQSISYGDIIATAFKNLVPDAPYSTCLAEALRFSARYGVAENAFPLDDMLAQDEMLEALELGELSVSLEPQDLFDAIKGECLRRTNRFMLLIPQSLGRVRITSIDADRLLEHCQAWCFAHEPQ